MAKDKKKETVIDVDDILKWIGGLVVVGLIGWVVVKLWVLLVIVGLAAGGIWWMKKQDEPKGPAPKLKTKKES